MLLMFCFYNHIKSSKTNKSQNINYICNKPTSVGRHVLMVIIVVYLSKNTHKNSV